jgi:hypothetical protein
MANPLIDRFLMMLQQRTPIVDAAKKAVRQMDGFLSDAEFVANAVTRALEERKAK